MLIIITHRNCESTSTQLVSTDTYADVLDLVGRIRSASENGRSGFTSLNKFDVLLYFAIANCRFLSDTRFTKS